MSDVIGKTIGSYTVLAQLGAGAMGEVYLAEHRHLKRKAALKLLAREIVDRPDLLERFFLEARATSAIAHPGIVQIFDCEVDAGGRPYIVMEHLTGETLAATLARRGPLPSVTAARMGAASPKRWTPRTARRSFIATSSPRTSSSSRPAGRRQAARLRHRQADG